MFGDREVEEEFLNTSLYSPVNLRATSAIMALYGFFSYVTALVKSQFLFDNSHLPSDLMSPYIISMGFTTASGTFFLVSMTLFLVASPSSRCGRGHNGVNAPVSTRSATVFAMIAFTLFFIRNFFDNIFLEAMFKYAVQASVFPGTASERGLDGLGNGTYSLDWSGTCAKLNYSGSLAPTDWNGVYNISSFSDISRAARVAGMLSTGNDGLFNIVLVWVGAKILVRTLDLQQHRNVCSVSAVTAACDIFFRWSTVFCRRGITSGCCAPTALFCSPWSGRSLAAFHLATWTGPQRTHTSASHWCLI